MKSRKKAWIVFSETRRSIRMSHNYRPTTDTPAVLSLPEAVAFAEAPAVAGPIVGAIVTSALVAGTGMESGMNSAVLPRPSGIEAGAWKDASHSWIVLYVTSAPPEYSTSLLDSVSCFATMHDVSV